MADLLPSIKSWSARLHGAIWEPRNCIVLSMARNSVGVQQGCFGSEFYIGLFNSLLRVGGVHDEEVFTMLSSLSFEDTRGEKGRAATAFAPLGSQF